MMASGIAPEYVQKNAAPSGAFTDTEISARID
jgi:hypothetical protein